MLSSKELFFVMRSVYCDKDSRTTGSFCKKKFNQKTRPSKPLQTIFHRMKSQLLKKQVVHYIKDDYRVDKG